MRYHLWCLVEFADPDSDSLTDPSKVTALAGAYKSADKNAARTSTAKNFTRGTFWRLTQLHHDFAASGFLLLLYETSDDSCRQMAKHAELNSVSDRISVRGQCDVGELTQDLKKANPQIFILMDVEGAELNLLRPDLAPQLASAYLLVEMHECFYPGLCAEIRSRFRQTHKIEEIWSRPKQLTESPVRSIFLDYWLLKLLHERDSVMPWFYMQPLHDAR